METIFAKLEIATNPNDLVVRLREAKNGRLLVTFSRGRRHWYKSLLSVSFCRLSTSPEAVLASIRTILVECSLAALAISSRSCEATFIRRVREAGFSIEEFPDVYLRDGLKRLALPAVIPVCFPTVMTAPMIDEIVQRLVSSNNIDTAKWPLSSPPVSSH